MENDKTRKVWVIVFLPKSMYNEKFNKDYSKNDYSFYFARCINCFGRLHVDSMLLVELLKFFLKTHQNVFSVCIKIK